jgi:hypothetical protein
MVIILCHLYTCTLQKNDLSKKCFFLVTWIWRTKIHQTNNRSRREIVNSPTGEIHTARCQYDADSGFSRINTVWYTGTVISRIGLWSILITQNATTHVTGPAIDTNRHNSSASLNVNKSVNKFKHVIPAKIDNTTSTPRQPPWRKNVKLSLYSP